MRLEPGQKLSHYRLVEKIGEGGMGVVWKAEDTKLRREVALKILPEAVSRNPESRTRFRREARLLASLNHTNIAAIHGFEETAGVSFLVLEMVPGEDLAKRLAAGPVAIPEALAIARQIAEGVEAAHATGIIHRDLKPANVKVTDEGHVKVLDFGLAKAFREGRPTDALSQSPTITAMATRDGIIMGTAGYMSPEQAKGRVVDHRADVWAFGCVLYELLTGRAVFAGDSVATSLANILDREPDWEALPAALPAPIQRLLRRCLTKDVTRRLQAIGDARIEIEEALDAPPELSAGAAEAAPGRRRERWRWTIWGSVLGLLAGAILAGAFLWSGRLSSPPALSGERSPVRFSITVPSTENFRVGVFNPVALSPDGQQLLYVAGNRLFHRELGALEATSIAGTEGAESPFFSPDGQWVGFLADGKLKKLSLLGGAPLSLTAANGAGSWGADDTIFFRSGQSGISRISAAGGTPEVVTTEGRCPEVLPGGKVLLFSAGGHIEALVLETGQRKTLIEEGFCARYAPPGHLLYARGRSLLAVPFDPSRLELTGSSIPIGVDIQTPTYTGLMSFSVSASGTLVYVPASRTDDRTLVRVDHQGEERPFAATRGYSGKLQRALRFSPDGRFLAVGIRGEEHDDIWIYELSRGIYARLTYEGASAPVWTPDGKRVVFASKRDGSWDLYWRPADGSGVAERLLEGENDQFLVPHSFLPDGSVLAYTEFHPETDGDIWLLPMEGERTPRPFLRTDAFESVAVFSPNGRWLAYVSKETGDFEIYVQPYPGPGGKWRISTEGGASPLWAANGGELYYRQLRSSPRQLLAVTIDPEPVFTASTPRLLIEANYSSAGGPYHGYDIAPSGEYFVFQKQESMMHPAQQLNVVLNWSQELQRLAPSR